MGQDILVFANTWYNNYYCDHIHTYIHTYTHIYIYTWDVSVAEWLAWLTSNCGRIGAIGLSPSNGLKPNLWGQKGFNSLCQCVYVYVCIVKPDIQTIHNTHIHKPTYTYIHTCIHTYIHTHTHTRAHTYVYNRLRWRSGYGIGQWAGRYWVRISVPAPTQNGFIKDL